MYSHSGHPRYRWICFIGLYLEKCGVTSFAVNGCHQNESPLQTADKNLTSNPHDSNPSDSILWSLKLCIHQDDFNFRPFLRYEKIHIAFSRKKVVLSESGEKYAQIKHCLQDKIVQISYMSVDFDMRGQQCMEFFCRKLYCGFVFWPEKMI